MEFEQVVNTLRMYKAVLKKGIRELDIKYIYSWLFKVHCYFANYEYKLIREAVEEYWSKEMPIYDICCTNKKCDYEEELIMKLEECLALLGTKCKKCKKGTIIHKIGASSFNLKGSDYYKPGFSGNSNKKK